MKVKVGEKRKPDAVKFSDLEIGDVFYYQWSEGDFRIKISNDSYFSVTYNTCSNCRVTSEVEYIKVKAELTVWKG